MVQLYIDGPLGLKEGVNRKGSKRAKKIIVLNPSYCFLFNSYYLRS